MKKVLKSPEPEELKNYKERFSSQFKRWNDLKRNKETLNAIRKTDKKACEDSGIPIENVQFTIDTLELNVQRLKNLRLAVIDEIEKELDDETIDINDLEEKIAAEYFGNGTDNWPRFFTTLR